MIRRVAPLPQDHFTVVRNQWVRDDRLSWKARGLLAYLSSHALTFETSLERLTDQGPDGRDAVRSGLNELADAGYLIRSRARNDDGTLAGVDMELTDPWDSPTLDNPTQVEPTQVHPTPKKTKLLEDQEKKIKNTHSHDEVTADFDSFWELYPRKVAKGQAVKAYRSARKITDADTILKAVKRYPFNRDQPQFIPYPATWLNGERWADELLGTTPATRDDVVRRQGGVSW